MVSGRKQWILLFWSCVHSSQFHSSLVLTHNADTRSSSMALVLLGLHDAMVHMALH